LKLAAASGTLGSKRTLAAMSADVSFGRMSAPKRLTAFNKLYFLSAGTRSIEKNSRMLSSGSNTEKPKMTFHNNGSVF
jgi:hypothetical protein